MAQITITLCDTTPSGGVAVHTTFKPALGQRLTTAQALALDLTTQASHRADVVYMQVQDQGDTKAASAFDTHTLSLPLEPLQ